jgi:hypothetical protein
MTAKYQLAVFGNAAHTATYHLPLSAKAAVCTLHTPSKKMAMAPTARN